MIASNLKKLSNKIIRSFSDVLAPRTCLICECLNPADSRFEFICNSCADSMPTHPTPDESTYRFLKNISPDDVCVSTAYYSLLPLEADTRYLELIHSLKYRGFTRIGSELGSELARYIKFCGSPDYDGIIPIPIHHARRRERGFNQSEIISLAVGNYLKIPVFNDLLRRSFYTRTQTLLNATERLENVSEAFFVSPGVIIKKKTILIIDDVLTTGATLNSAAGALLEAGARRVDTATLAMA